MFWITYLLLIISILVCVGFITLLERKLLSMAQLRLGPNKVSLLGMFQPFLDGIKLFKKMELKQISNYYILFKIMSLFTFMLAMLLMTSIPLGIFQNKSLMIMWILMILGVMSFCILLMGWSSLNKYSMLGGSRSLAQTLSFEINLTILFLLPFFMKHKFNIQLNEMFFLTLLGPYYIMLFMLSMLEMQRAPMDLSEGESELVSGYTTEYGSVSFTFIFLAEYLVMLFFILVMSLLTKMFMMMLYLFLVMIIRCCYPRLRYDTLMNMFWCKMLPMCLMLWLMALPCKII